MANLVSRNRMTATQLKEQEGSINFVKNPKNGNLFFTAGKYTGYVSPAVKEQIMSVQLSDLQFAECKDESLPDRDPVTGSSNWVPCLMMVGDSSKNVVRSL